MADRIIKFQYDTEENSLNKVVKTVHWRYRGTDETSGISTIKSILGIV